MTEDELKERKMAIRLAIREHMPEDWDDIDPRLRAYVLDCVRDDMDTASVYELAGIRKVIRLWNSYERRGDRVRRYIAAIEGIWENGRHVAGGLRFDTPRGEQHVRLMPYQVWCLFGMYGLDTEVDMEREWKDGDELLPTEFVRDGMVYDRRRLCTEAHIFQTRKSGKTEFGAALDFVESCLMGPKNAQVLVAANSREQAKIAYSALKKFGYQLDPDATSKSGGRRLRITADEMNFKPGNDIGRSASVKVMSAGGKKKDGLYASMVHADEHGSASYVKDHSDMQDLVEVCSGSMGPRRERMLLHTTTAGLVTEGPYQLQLRQVEDSLLKDSELEIDGGEKTMDDGWFAFLLRLDPWDFKNDDIGMLNKPNLWRKVNRSIGITVQPTWYRERLHAAETGGHDTRKEVLTKDFNIWQTDRVKLWMTDRDIRPLQVSTRVDDLQSEDGWLLFVGFDFSQGNDLHAASYLCYNQESGEFFADMDAWVTEKAVSESPVRPLLEKWVANGWLHLCPGGAIDDDVMTNRVSGLLDRLTMVQVGYDAYKAKIQINNLRALVHSLGGDPDKIIRPVSQGFATYTSPVQEMEYLVRSNPALIHFSHNPMWVWEFGNCMLAESSDGYGNLKPVKSSPTAKVDNVQALLSALYCFDQANAKAN